MVLYGDESDFGRYPCMGNDWSRQACQEKVRTKGKNKKRYLFGAREARTGHLYVRWARKKNGSNFVAFLKSLVRHFAGLRILLILDNFKVHTCRLVERWLGETQAPVDRLFLPTYSPWLNLIENDWRALKRRVHMNTWRDTTGQIVRDVSRTLLAMHATILLPALKPGST